MSSGSRHLSLVLGIIAMCLWIAGCPAPGGGGPSPAPSADKPEVSVMFGETEIPVGGAADIGSTTIGTPKDVKLTVRNTGAAALSLAGTPLVAISGADSALFSVTSFPASTIGQGGSEDFHVLFSPTSTGTKTVGVTIANSDDDEGSYAFTLQGSATAVPEPEINVNGPAGTPIPSGSGSYVFTSTIVGSSTSATFTVQNLGSIDLTLGGTPRAAIGGSDPTMFTVSAQPASPVASAGSTTFTVQFTPGSAGAKSATVSIANNDTNENPYTFTLNGAGVVVPEMNVKQGSTDVASGTLGGAFGTLMTGEYADLPFTVENLGSAVLNLAGTPRAAITGTGASNFVVTLQPGATVSPAGGTTPLTVRFSPLTAGSFNVTVSIANNDSDENPYTFQLTGNAVNWHGARTLDSTGDVGEYASVALGTSPNTVHVSYYDRTNGALKYARSTNGGVTWTVTTVATGSVGQYTSIMRIPMDNTICISYYDVANGDLKFIRSTDDGVTWPAGNIRTVDSNGDVGKWTSLSCYQGRVYLTYLDAGNSDLKFAWSSDSGNTWLSANVTTIDAGGMLGVGSSIVNYGGVNLFVSYVDPPGSSVRFAKSTDEGVTWPSTSLKVVRSNVSGSNVSSIATNGALNVFVASTGSSSFFLSKSTDGGTTWGSNTYVDAMGTLGGALSLKFAASTLHYAYCTGDTVKYAQSADSGATWPVMKTVQAGITFSETVSLAVSGSTIYIVYRDDGSGKQDLRIAKSLDGGATW